MKKTTPKASIALLFAALACGGDSDSQPDARQTDAGSIDASAGLATTHYAPPTPGEGGDWGAVPYPSDLYLDTDGLLALTSLPVGPSAQQNFVEMLLESLHTMDGAGVWSSLYIPVDGDVDPDTLAGNVLLVNLDDGLEEVPLDVVWRADLGAIVGVPRFGNILLQKTRYGAYVTDGVTGTDGSALQPGALFAEAADLTTTPGDAEVAAAQENIRPLLAALSPDVAARVVSATVFTTESVADEAMAMRDVVAATPPTVAVDQVFDDEAGLNHIFGVQDPDAPVGMLHGAFRAQPHGHVAAVVHGFMSLANFLSDTPGVDGFATFADGVPVVKGHDPAKFTLILPVAADYENLPVVLYVAGINRPRIDMLVQADTAAKNGQAVLAVDLAYHGDRATAPTDVMNDMTGEMEPDGFGDLQGLTAAVSFFHLANSGGIPGYHPRAMRENLRQAAIDVCSLVSFVTGGDTAPISAALGGQPVSFRTDTVALVSESFGALVSGVSLAIEPKLGVASYSSPAAGMPFPSMIHSPPYSSLFMNAVTIPFDIGDRVTLGDPERDARFEPIIMFYNSALERGDATAYAPYVLDGSLRGGVGPSLLITESYSDEWVPNNAEENYAGALGLSRVQIGNESALPDPPMRYASLPTIAAPVSGNVGGGARTAGLSMYHPSPHAVIRKLTDESIWEPGFPPFVERDEPIPIDPTPIARIHTQWSTLVTEHFAGGGAPTIVDPYAE